jgi:hypothetical protein
MHWVDCRDPGINPLDQLFYGITGTSVAQS